MGYFSQQALDVLNADLTIIEQLQKDFPQDGLGALRSLAGVRLPIFRRRYRQEDSLAIGRREIPFGDGAYALRPAEFSGSRRAYKPPRSQASKEMLVEALKDFEGTMIFVSHDRTFLRGLGTRVLELGGESGEERNQRLYPGTYIEYVTSTGHEAPGSHS